jgi:galactokinase
VLWQNSGSQVFLVKGFDAAITGNMPIGSGLSSSAAVECATAMALNHLLQSRFNKLQMVQLSQRAENDFVGVQCGIMDQFASMFGRADHAIKLDCRSLAYEYIPLSMDDLRIVLLNTNVKHSHGSSAYNERRAQCEAGVAILRQHEPQVTFLRDATKDMVNRYLSAGDATIYKRCKFIVEENERVVGACADLKHGELASFGKKMYASHHGLQNLFEASCAELDFLVDCVRNNPAVLGARMMGGGFGGCTINLVKADAIETLISEVSARYSQSMNMELTPHIASIESGTTMLKQPAAHA